MGEVLSVVICFLSFGFLCDVPNIPGGPPPPGGGPTVPTPPTPPTPPTSAYYTLNLRDRQCFPNSPCTECVGDCDSDDDCAGSFRCFQRTGQQLVPGCLGTGDTGQDYCYDPQAPFSVTLQGGGANVGGAAAAGSCTPDRPCGLCQGDCQTDADCHGNLRCYQKDGGPGQQNIPGCKGVDPSDKDYCYDPSIPSTRTLVDFGFTGCTIASPCDACQGDCDSDADCRGNQRCFLRDGSRSVPGCLGSGVGDLDYCYDDNPAPPPIPPPTPTPPAPTPPTNSGGGFTIRLNNVGAVSDYDDAFRAAANRWGEIITNDLPDIAAGEIGDIYGGQFPGRESTERIDDVTIGYEFSDLPGNIVGRAGPRWVRADGTTISGIMQFDTSFFRDNSPSSRAAVILHEMGHVLGLGTRWTSCAGGCAPGGAVVSYQCSMASQAYNRLNLGSNFGTGQLQIENEGGPGSACGHWDDRSFNALIWTELMIYYIDPTRAQLITTATLAALEDVAAYRVDYSKADPIPPPISTIISYGTQSDRFVDLGQIEDIPTSVYQFARNGNDTSVECVENCDEESGV